MKVKLDLGAELDFVTPAELDKSLDRLHSQAQAIERERLAGAKYRRLPQLAGQAASGGGGLNIGGDITGVTASGAPTWNGQSVGPNQGYVWDIGLLSVAGLTPGSTPDIVNLFIRGAGSSLPWWQFNGNNFAYTFGRGELLLLPGETLQLVSQGTFAATGTVTLFGSIRNQVVAEMIGKVTAS